MRCAQWSLPSDSGELHGGLLQSLVALKIRMKLLAAGENSDDRERMRLQIASEIDDAIQEVKRILTSLGEGTTVRATVPNIGSDDGEDSRTVVRVLLVDEHPAMRAGLRALLETDERIGVVGEASSHEEAVEKARTLAPDIVIVDLSMPGMDGIRTTRHVTKLGFAAKVLVVTIHDEDEFLVSALNAGAAGFLYKSVADSDLIGAIEAIVRGHSYLPRQATAPVVRRKAQGNSSPTPALKVLSSREAAVIELYASGLSARETGEEMFLSSKTVESYLARAKAKLGLHARRDIVRFALEAGLLRADGER